MIPTLKNVPTSRNITTPIPATASAERATAHWYRGGDFLLSSKNPLSQPVLPTPPPHSSFFVAEGSASPAGCTASGRTVPMKPTGSSAWSWCSSTPWPTKARSTTG